MPPPSRSSSSNPVRLFDKADGEDDFKHDNEDDDEEEEEESDGVEKSDDDFKLKLDPVGSIVRIRDDEAVTGSV